MKSNQLAGASRSLRALQAAVWLLAPAGVPSTPNSKALVAVAWLRTPLAVVRGLVSMLEKSLVKEEFATIAPCPATGGNSNRDSAGVIGFMVVPSIVN